MKGFFSSIRYHGSSSSIKCHVNSHVGGGGIEDTPVVCNESRGPHTSHYPSRQVTKNNQQTTHTSHYPSRPVEFLNTEAKRCFATHDEDVDYFNMRIYIILIDDFFTNNCKLLGVVVDTWGGFGLGAFRCHPSFLDCPLFNFGLHI